MKLAFEDIRPFPRPTLAASFQVRKQRCTRRLGYARSPDFALSIERLLNRRSPGAEYP